ncbi:hypothetical protein ABTQ09_20105, partial [Acinetobacter baumannii]
QSAAATRRERQDDVRAAVAAVVANLPRGDSYPYTWPEGVTAEQLLRAQEEDKSMHRRLG